MDGTHMSLFTDGSISTIEELLGYESAILDVAKIEGIDLTTKLKLAEEELTVDLQAFLARQNDPRRIEQIVVTESLHKWHTFRALSVTYRDAYNRQLNDRYEGKWQEYQRLANWAAGALFEAGVGMVNMPIPRAEASKLSTAPGPQGAAVYFVSVTWQGPTGAEGAPSILTAMTAAAGNALTVKAVNAPEGVSGWNVYAGYSGTDLSLQNDTPLTASQTWLEPASGLGTGRPVGHGQDPDSYLRQSARRIFDRG
jgi:hypothetical protein